VRVVFGLRSTLDVQCALLANVERRKYLGFVSVTILIRNETRPHT